MDAGSTVAACVQPRLTKMINPARNGAAVGSCDDQLPGLLRAAAGMAPRIVVKDTTRAVCLLPLTLTAASQVSLVAVSV